MEGKRNDVGLRFVLDPNAGDGGFLLWNEQVIPALIDWLDPVVQHGLRHKIKYVRLIRRKASSTQAQGADCEGNRYYVQLVLEGHAFTKKKHEKTGVETVGLDIGPQTLAMVSREGKADLVTFCQELETNAREKRRLQRKMDRQRRANNPENYDEKGRVKKHGKTRLRWKESRRYKATRQQYAHTERRLAAHRKSLHGKLAHAIVKMGKTINIEKTSFKGWQKQYGRSIGRGRTRDVCSAFGPHSCENWRHPERSFNLPDQTLTVLPSVQALCEETQITALASLCMWMRAGAA